MTRRGFFVAATVVSAWSATPKKSKLSVEGYIFEQYAQALKRPLEAVMDQVLPMARAAGFRNIELSSDSFPPEGRERPLSIIRQQGLLMPSLYVGGSSTALSLQYPTRFRKALG